MKRNLKLVFFVNDHTDQEGIAGTHKIVDAQQTFFEVSVEDLMKPIIEKTQSGEAIEAVGVMVSKFVALKLREWALAQGSGS